MNNDHGYLFFKYLTKIIASLENRVPCYVLGIHKVAEVRKLALQIMKDGLKADIKSQQALMIRKEEKNLFINKLRCVLLPC